MKAMMMLDKARDWFGFSPAQSNKGHGHEPRQ